VLRISPADAVAHAHHELATEFVEDLRRLDAQLRDTRKKPTAAVKASGTGMAETSHAMPRMRSASGNALSGNHAK
jgi:hypothetical protein